MRATVVEPYSDYEEYFVALEIPTSSDCELIGISERSEIELCEDCTKEFARFMKGEHR